MTKKLSRRDFVKLGEAVTGATVLASCRAQATSSVNPKPPHPFIPITPPPICLHPTIGPTPTTDNSLMTPTEPVVWPDNTVSNHLYRVAGEINTPIPCECCDVYIVKTSDTWETPVLIECGSSPGWQQLINNLTLPPIGIDPGNIAWIFGSHGHYDHMENMALFQQNYPQVKFALHAADAQFVINNDCIFSCAATLYKGAPTWPIKVDRLLLDGDQIQVGNNTFEITHTPGHTPGSIVIKTTIEGHLVGFCGDSVTGCFSSYNRSNALDWQKSIQRLLDIANSTNPFELLIWPNNDWRLQKDRTTNAPPYMYILKNMLAATTKKWESQIAEEDYVELWQWW
jgi:glyoxylase-like metal-dependent hydrolase (beta-lactamase superfamily II)